MPDSLPRDVPVVREGCGEEAFHRFEDLEPLVRHTWHGDWQIILSAAAASGLRISDIATLIEKHGRFGKGANPKH